MRNIDLQWPQQWFSLLSSLGGRLTWLNYNYIIIILVIIAVGRERGGGARLNASVTIIAFSVSLTFLYGLV